MDTFVRKYMKKELSMYLVVGVCAVFTDYGTYMLLRDSISTSSAKTISYIAGMLVAFVLNRSWTFKSTKKAHVDFIKFTILYITSLGLNVATNHIMLFVFPVYVTFAFLVATGVSVVTNYVGQKFWVFANKQA